MAGPEPNGPTTRSPYADPNGWGEYRRMVIAELERLHDYVEGVDKKLDALRVDLAYRDGMLKGRAGAMGAIGGGLVAIASVIASIFVHH